MELKPIITELEELAASFAMGKVYREGVRVVLTGRPNVGKSSLLNALVGEERAIVHDAPGTTRDVIEEEARFGELRFRLVDTAGLREGGETVEQLGVARSYQWIDRADQLVLVLDGSVRMTAEDETFWEQFRERRPLVALNKMDLGRCIFPVFEGAAWQGWLSAKTGEGLEELKTAMVASALGGRGVEAEGMVVTKLRHKEAIDRAAVALKAADTALQARESVECVAHHLRQATLALGEITGEVTTDHLLDAIFSEFCIGK